MVGEQSEAVAGRFVVDGAIGGAEGCRGYRARDLESGAPVALRVVAGQNGERLLQAAELSARLAHPAVARHIADGVLDDGKRFLVTEWVEGPTLAQTLRAGPLPIADVVAVGARVFGALASAHALGA